MKDRLLPVLTGIACATPIWLAWVHFPNLTMSLIALPTVVSSWRQQRRDRLREKLRLTEGDRRERLRQLQRLAGTLAALRDRRT